MKAIRGFTRLCILLATAVVLSAGAATNNSVYVTMPDGVRLAADIWLPESVGEFVGDTQKVPAIVEFTRYWRATEMVPPSDNMSEARRQTLDHGYAFVAVDVRGTGASFGVRNAEFSLAEARDMPHVVDWIATQPWSNGKVVSMGISYDGNTAELAALNRSPALVAAVPRFTDFDWYTSIVVPGGLKNAYITERWGDAVQSLDRNDARIFGAHQGEASAENPKIIGVKPVDADVDRKLLEAATKEHFGNRSLADNLGDLVYRDEYPSATSLDDDAGMAISIHNFEEEFEASETPMFHWGSWFDAGTAAGVLARFQSFDAPYRYVIGPWSHGASFDANPFQPREAPVDPTLEQQFEQIFEFANDSMSDHLRLPAKELTYYTVGENAWKSTDVWPPHGHRLVRWWLHDGGTLATTPPEAKSGADQYKVNFNVGSGTSSRWATQLGGGDVYYPDRTEVDKLLLTYTSPPLDEAVEITGTAIATINVSSTHDDGALIIYLEDVDENGHVRMLTEGQLRLRHRATDAPPDSVFGPSRSYAADDGQLLTPGEVLTVEIALLPVSARIDKGHSIRIAIAGHDKDTFIRVPTEGDPVLNIERNALQASFIDLPVIERPQAPAALAVEAWADTLFGEAVQHKRMSGAVITMVKNGDVVLSKGYGYADYASGTPVDPRQTRFRIGSITKTFTAMAIAQLMDQGLIRSLDEPANDYLQRLQLRSPGGIDVTLKHLLTHSAGFENRVYNIATDREYELPLSVREIARYEPSIVSAPGQYSSYNNYGTSILGLIVEDVSGQAIADYFEEHIFAPLGMTNSTLNMSPEPSEGLGKPYAFLPNGEPAAIPHRTVHPFYAPVGGVNATGADMARYMIAQLAAGTDEGAVLSAEMYKKMHSRIRANHPQSSGFGMIYFTLDWNGLDIVVHGGDWPGTHSAMMLFPQLDTGIFFSLMAERPEVPILEGLIGSERLTPASGVTVDTPVTNLGVMFNFIETFFGRYGRPSNREPEVADLRDYEGSYVGLSAPYSTMERLLSLGNPFNVVNVTADETGNGLIINGKGPYTATGADSFWNEQFEQTPLDGLFLDSPTFHFVRNEAGAIDYLVPLVGFDVWVKSGMLSNPQFYATAWGILLLVSLTAAVAIFYPRISGRRWAKWLPGLVLVGLITQPLVFMLGYTPGTTIVDDLFFGHGGRFILFTMASVLVALMALILGWHVVLAWRESFWSGTWFGIALRLHYTILGIAALLFIPVFSFLNLLGS